MSDPYLQERDPTAAELTRARRFGLIVVAHYFAALVLCGLFVWQKLHG